VRRSLGHGGFRWLSLPEAARVRKLSHDARDGWQQG
jgi:hypothetical protein